MSAELLALLDGLDAAREKATPGEWVQHPADADYVIADVADDGASYTDVADTYAFRSGAGSVDAALIVAEHNAMPKLTAALRAVLELAEQFEAEAEVREVRATVYPPSGPWAIDHNRLVVRADTFRRAATRLRAAIADALTPEQVQS